MRVIGLKVFAIVLGAASVTTCASAGGVPESHDLRGANAPASGQLTGLDLIRTNNCLACHQVNQKRVGPAFTLIAQRFAGQAGAAEYLAGAIRQGGKGRWGPVPMPAQPQVSPEQARAIAAWILTLAAPGFNPS
ncbi:MAG: c-type cytochrome [Paralcaligenes sp.]